MLARTKEKSCSSALQARSIHKNDSFLFSKVSPILPKYKTTTKSEELGWTFASEEQQQETFSSYAEPVEFVNFSEKDPQEWNITEVLYWLEDTELSKLQYIITKHKINGAKLLQVTEGDLETMGVKELGLRKKFIRSVKNAVNEFNASRDISIICTFNDQTHFFNLKELSYSLVCQSIFENFQCAFQLKYTDQEGDILTCHNDEDLEMAMSTRRVIKLQGAASITPGCIQAIEGIVGPAAMVDSEGIVLYLNSEGVARFKYDAINKDLKSLVSHDELGLKCLVTDDLQDGNLEGTRSKTHLRLISLSEMVKEV